jgi:phosphoribosylformimino-5-aminoimidazole carboxamide ribotide isomerase
MQDQVVHALRGQRQAYQPLQSQLCSGSDPLNVVAALMDFYPFQQCYVADLDAIMKRGTTHHATMHTLTARYPQVQWWLDDGSTHAPSNKPENLLPVLGTESFPELSRFNNNYVLSLDERGGELLGDAQIHHTPGHWPTQVIAMSLAQVGSNNGPNYGRLRQYCTDHPSHDWYAAGGVRDIEDLQQLKRMGVKGALVATALHLSRLSLDDLKSL